MDQQHLTTSAAPTVRVRVSADLYLSGWDKEEIQIQSDDRMTNLKEGETIQITALDDCFISVPRGAQVIVEKANGDADVRDLSGSVEVLRVGGDCFMRNVGSARIEKIGGDLKLEAISAVSVAAVGGDLSGKQLGDLTADGVGGDVAVADISGALKARAGGDINAQFSAVTGQAVNLAAGGDVELIVPVDASIALAINSGSQDIEIRVGGQRLEFEEYTLRHTLGTGTAPFSISAGGDVEVRDTQSGETVRVDFTRYDGRWERQMRHAAERVEHRLRKMDDMPERIAKRAEESVRRAQARIDAAMRRQEMAVPPVPPIPPVPPVPPVPFAGAPVDKPAGKVSEEEHMLILRMLQEKKITVEEAEQLLEALENQAQDE